MSRDTKKMIPCDCPKGGIYTTAEGGERVCDRCDGLEYVEDTQMNKEEIKKRFGKIKEHKGCDRYVCEHGYIHRLAINRRIFEEWHKKELAKQRTQLLARVREEVIGENDYGADNIAQWDKEKIRNELKQEQLKELEIISEE